MANFSSQNGRVQLGNIENLDFLCIVKAWRPDNDMVGVSIMGRLIFQNNHIYHHHHTKTGLMSAMHACQLHCQCWSACHGRSSITRRWVIPPPARYSRVGLGVWVWVVHCTKLYNPTSTCNIRLCTTPEQHSRSARLTRRCTEASRQHSKC